MWRNMQGADQAARGAGTGALAAGTASRSTRFSGTPTRAGSDGHTTRTPRSVSIVITDDFPHHFMYGPDWAAANRGIRGMPISPRRGPTGLGPVRASRGIAALLSFFVVVGCGAWYDRVTSGNVPDRSVDLWPVVPIVIGVGALALIWLAAAVAWIARVVARARRVDCPEGKRDDQSAEPPSLRSAR